MIKIIFFLLWFSAQDFKITLPPKNVTHTRQVVHKGNKQVKTIPNCDALSGFKNGSILCKVYGLESTWGKNDSCKSRGMVNGFGYASNRVCFKTLEEAARKVDEWFERELKTKTEAAALCYYNTGTTTKNCAYNKKAKTIRPVFVEPVQNTSDNGY